MNLTREQLIEQLEIIRAERDMWQATAHNLWKSASAHINAVERIVNDANRARFPDREFPNEETLYKPGCSSGKCSDAPPSPPNTTASAEG